MAEDGFKVVIATCDGAANTGRLAVEVAGNLFPPDPASVESLEDTL